MSGSGSSDKHLHEAAGQEGPLALLSEHRFLADEAARFLQIQEQNPRPTSYGTSVLSMSMAVVAVALFPCFRSRAP